MKGVSSPQSISALDDHPTTGLSAAEEHTDPHCLPGRESTDQPVAGTEFLYSNRQSDMVLLLLGIGVRMVGIAGWRTNGMCT